MTAAEPKTLPLLFYCTAHGQPAPQGSKRHVGNGRMVEASAAVAPWREAVKTAARVSASMPSVPLDGPLKVELVFTVRKPASAPKRRVTLPDKKPDIDKLARAVLDALTDAGVWVDDSRVVTLHAHKCYPGEGGSTLASPGVVVRIWRADA